LARANIVDSYTNVLKLLSGFARERSVEFRKFAALKESDETAQFADLYDAVQSIGWLREQNPDQVESERTAKFTLNMAGIVAARIRLPEVDFSLVTLRGADFTGSDIRSGRFWRTDLRYGKLHGVNAQWVDFGQALFQNTVLDQATFDSCNFEGVSFADASLESATFAGCNISRAHFETSSGLKTENIADAWAWKNEPPHLPTGVSFDRYYDPGPQDAIYLQYRESRRWRRGFSPPD
jgi:hypothetical protein